MRELVNEVNGESKTTLRPDIAKWVEALRSGEYNQGKYALEMEGGFCCLGVYCKVHNISYTPVEYDDKVNQQSQDDVNIPVYEKLRELIYPCVFDEGINMNDSGRSFAEIADMIEKYYTEEESNA